MPDHLVDLNGVAELTGIVDKPDALWIGAMSRQRELERSSVVAECCPMLRLAVAHIGQRRRLQLQHRQRNSRAINVDSTRGSSSNFDVSERSQRGTGNAYLQYPMVHC